MACIIGRYRHAKVPELVYENHGCFYLFGMPVATIESIASLQYGLYKPVKYIPLNYLG